MDYTPESSPWDDLGLWASNPPDVSYWKVTYDGDDMLFKCENGFSYGGDTYTVAFHLHPVGSSWVFGSMWAEGLRWENYRRDGSHAVGGIRIQNDVSDQDGLRTIVWELAEVEA
ncbi:MAG: hypothetical protein ACRD0D_01840 [Acidimicrobiales bacterium]